MDRYPYPRYTILLEATRALAHIGVHIYTQRLRPIIRLDRFDGSNFTRWQDKVRFLLTTLKIFYMLDPSLAILPKPKEDDTTDVMAKNKKTQAHM